MSGSGETIQGPRSNPMIGYIPILRPRSGSPASARDEAVAEVEGNVARPPPVVARKAAHRFDPPRDLAQYALAYKQAMGDVLRVIAVAANSGPWERCDDTDCPMCDLVLAAQRLAVQVARRSTLEAPDT